MRPGILVIGHGSREAVWVERVEAAVREAAFLLQERTGAAVPVEAAYLELVEGRLIQDGVNRLEASGVTDLLAIPFFISSGSKHVREIGWALGAWDEPAGGTDLAPVRIGARLTYGRPVDDDPEIADALLDKIAPFSSDPAGEAVLLIGHGNAEPEMRRAWLRGMSGLAERVRARGGYAAADVALLATDDPAAKAEALRRDRPSMRVLAVPVFLSEGYFTAEAVPRRLRGAPCDYAETALLPHPKLAEWIARQSAEWLAQLVKSDGVWKGWRKRDGTELGTADRTEWDELETAGADGMNGACDGQGNRDETKPGTVGASGIRRNPERSGQPG